MKALKDESCAHRTTTALFWFILAFTFIAGPYLPKWITGLCVVFLAILTAFKRVAPSKSDMPKEAETRAAADRLGYSVFIPPLVLAVSAVLVATFLKVLGANNAIGISGSIALVTAGVGDVIAGGVSAIIPAGNLFAATAVYCIAMALFTMIMGNGFAAFSVITVGIGIPFLIAQGADPVVVGALGLTAGYCGTLMTPMAANFNILPAALLETKNKYIVILSQLPVALVMLAVHIVLMYTLAFR